MVINLSHGAGGQSTAELVKTIFSRHLNNDILGKMEDGAKLNVSGEIVMTTDSFVVTPLIYKGGDIGKLCVCGTVNDLLMMGAVPKYISAGFIIETGMDMDVLEKLVISMSETAKEAGVIVVAADTKVIEGSGGLYINTTGIGKIRSGANVSGSGCEVGDAIILSGNLGDHHAAIISERMDIENDIESDNAPLNSLVDILFDNNITVNSMRDVTRGGLGTVLNELAQSSGVQAIVYENELPVQSTVLGLCDILGLDPMYMGNEGKFVLSVPFSESEKALNLLKSQTLGENARIIGQFKEGSGVYLQTQIGNQRKISMLYGEGLPRIC